MGKPEGLLNLRHQMEREGLLWRWGLRGQQSQASTRSKRKGLQPSLKVFSMVTAPPSPPTPTPGLRSELAPSENPALNWNTRSALHLAFPEATTRH